MTIYLLTTKATLPTTELADDGVEPWTFLTDESGIKNYTPCSDPDIIVDPQRQSSSGETRSQNNHRHKASSINQPIHSNIDLYPSDFDQCSNIASGNLAMVPDTAGNSINEETRTLSHSLDELENLWNFEIPDFEPFPGEPFDSIPTGVNHMMSDVFGTFSTTQDLSTKETISADSFQHLVGLYFEKVHSFVPIIHRPKFFEKYFPQNHSISDEDATTLCHESILVNGMLALALRFYSSTSDAPSFRYGERNQFEERAKDIYYRSLRTGQKPHLDFLKGCVLLAFQLYLHGPNTEGWLIISTCTRLANDLGLNTVDSQGEGKIDRAIPTDWAEKEEWRRVWWSVWELDTFSSAVACRPHIIDRTNMWVKLPVSDENWFSGLFVESAIINPDPIQSWHTLRGCPNQDERAWFLLVNYLLLTAHDLGQQRYLKQKNVDDVETAISCFSLLLPRKFHALEQLSPASFWPHSIAKFNWVICTNIMLQGCRVLIQLLKDGSSCPKFWSASKHLLTTLAAEAQDVIPNARFGVYMDNMVRILKVWQPHCIPVATPFIGCLVLGPAAMHLRVAISLRGKDSNTASLVEELLKLCLSQLAKHWDIGSLLLDIANSTTALNEPGLDQSVAGS